MKRVSLCATAPWLLLLCIIFNFSISSRAQSIDLVTAAVDPAQRIALRGQRAPWALPEFSVGQIPDDTMLEHLTLILKRSPQKQRSFERFLQRLQDPTSATYHRWLTPTEIGMEFGASAHDIKAVSIWLRGQGLKVDSTGNNRLMIDFSGSASAVSAAFGTPMRYYRVSGEQRMATANDPQIPAALSNIIQSISGLNTLNDHSYHGAGQAAVPADGASSEQPAFSICDGDSCVYYITPLDFVTIYDMTNSWNLGFNGTGQTIAIIGRAKVYLPDIENFQTLSGLGTKDPTIIVPPGGLDPGPAAGTGTASGDQLEATLDVMRSTSVAPGATIDLVVSADDNSVSGLRIAAQYVVDSDPVPAQVMNISFGACEADRTQSDVQFWDGLFSQAAAEGISVFVASGDAGAAGCDTYFATPPQNQVASPNYICSSSYSTCVGGTEFADTANPSLYWSQSSSNAPPYASALQYIPEGGWNEPLNGAGAAQAASSGGGFSSYIPTPSWQTGTGVPGTQGRYTPDIAFSASAHDGYFGCLAASGGTHPGNCVLQNGTFYFEYFFGTSAAAPDMAGIAAMLNQKMNAPQGELNQRLYQIAANTGYGAFHDVTVDTSGVSDCVVTTPSMCNNSTPSPTGLTGGFTGYLVTPGFDEVTGLGSIDVTNLLNSWVAGSATTTTLSSNLNPANLGVSVSFTATVTTTGSNAPTGVVSFYDGATELPSYASLIGSVATYATPALSAGTHSITAVYRGDANNAPSTSLVLTQTIIPPTFTWTASGSTAATVLSGQSATYNFVAAPTGGAQSFAATVNFSCSGVPDSTVSCTFYPSQIGAGSGQTSVQVVIATTGPNAPAGSIRRHAGGKRFPPLPGTLPLACLVMIGLASRDLSKRGAASLLLLCVTISLLGLLVGCGSGGGGGTTTPPVVVAVSPGVPASLFPNDAGDNWPPQTAQFMATVSNSSNTAVTWTVSPANAGTISASGLYTAPNVTAGLPVNVNITATSQASPTSTGTATETLNAATVPGTYTNIMITATESTTANPVAVNLTVQ